MTIEKILTNPNLNNNGEIIIIGASTRAAAFSALRAGLTPVCIDMFADGDLKQVAETQHTLDYKAGLKSALATRPSAPVIYVGGIENQPEVISLAQQHDLWGNNQATIDNIRDPEKLAEVMRLSRAHFPEWRDASNPPPTDGTWVLRPINSCAGRGMTIWNAEAAQHPTLQQPHGFQKFISGVSYSAVFIAYAGIGDIRFVGITQQRVGEVSSHAVPFQWCGNVGPVTLSVGVEHTVRRVGNVLKWKSGLKGIFGIDFILDDQERIWVTEVNPRYPASTELLEHVTGLQLLAEHVRSFDPENTVTSDWSNTHDSDILGKAILYSPKEFTLSHQFTQATNVHELPEIADLPEVGTVIKQGDPICSIFSSGATLDAVEKSLQEKLKLVEQTCLGKTE